MATINRREFVKRALVTGMMASGPSRIVTAQSPPVPGGSSNDDIQVAVIGMHNETVRNKGMHTLQYKYVFIFFPSITSFASPGARLYNEHYSSPCIL